MIMEQQIGLAADNGIAYFSFCWYWQDDKGSIKHRADIAIVSRLERI
jgi:hypothetical protein